MAADRGRDPTVPRLERVRCQQQRLIARHPAGIGVVTVVQRAAADAVALASAEQRAAAAIVRESRAHVRAMAYVFEDAGGAWPRLPRGVASRSAVIAQPGFPTAVCDEAAEAAEWLAPRLGGDDARASAAELATALRVVLQRFAAGAPRGTVTGPRPRVDVPPSARRASGDER